MKLEDATPDEILRMLRRGELLRELDAGEPTFDRARLERAAILHPELPVHAMVRHGFTLSDAQAGCCGVRELWCTRAVREHHPDCCIGLIEQINPEVVQMQLLLR